MYWAMGGDPVEPSRPEGGGGASIAATLLVRQSRRIKRRLAIRSPLVAGTVRFAGPEGACIAMLGMEPTAIVAGTISRLTHPDDRLDFEEALNRVLRLQRSRDLTL